MAPPEYNIFIRQYTGDIEVLWTRDNYIDEAYLRSNQLEKYALLKNSYLELKTASPISAENLSLLKINALILQNKNFDSLNGQYSYLNYNNSFNLLLIKR